MPTTSTVFHEVLATVRQTAAAHASALDLLERALSSETTKLAAGQEALEVERVTMLIRAAETSERERAAIADEREAVESAWTELEAERARMAVVQPSSEEQFKLNVGGVRYETSRATLTSVPESMLATMFGARVDMLRRHPEDGSIFIDRNGERFGLVLDYLRSDGDATQLARAIRELPEPQHEAMLRELDFFGLLDAAMLFSNILTDNAEFQGGTRLGTTRLMCAAAKQGRSIVVFGGCHTHALKTTEMLDIDDYDEASFTPGPSMATPRVGCAAVRLDARRVMVIGGSAESELTAPSLDTTEVLDFDTMSFSEGPRMRADRFGCAAVAVAGGRVLVVGGGDERSSHKTTELLDVATMTFALGPEMLSSRYRCTAFSIDERRVMVVGGCGSDQVSSRTTEVLDLETMTFSRGPSMRTARFGCSAAPLGDGRHFLVIGGLDGDLTKLDSTEVLDLEAMEFSDGPKMRTAHVGISAVADNAPEEEEEKKRPKRVFVLGGFRQTDSGLLVAVTEVLQQTAARSTRRRRRLI